MTMSIMNMFFYIQQHYSTIYNGVVSHILPFFYPKIAASAIWILHLAILRFR